MQGCPALVVCLVHRGTLLHQEAHHLQVLVDAGLGGRTRCHPHLVRTPHALQAGPPAGTARQIQGQAALTVKEKTQMALESTNPVPGGPSSHPAV